MSGAPVSNACFMRARWLAIDERDARTLTLEEIKALWNRPDVSCSIRVDRKGETRAALLRLTMRR
jgi:hypothetical protein